MTRFGINVLLAALAIVLAACAVASFFTTVMIPISPLPRQAAFVHFYEGRFRAFWIQSTGDPLAISLMGNGPDLRIEPYYEWPPLPAWAVGADIPRKEWFRTITIGGYRNVPAFGGGWRTPMSARAFGLYTPANSTFVRMPAWLPTILLLYSPVRAIIRGVRERYRKRNNLCQKCGYLLHALTIPRCPECGEAIAIHQATS
jgi:hypothetical protein